MSGRASKRVISSALSGNFLVVPTKFVAAGFTGSSTMARVLSGSLCGWGDPLIPEFGLVVFLVVPTPVRLARLRAREIDRYGQHAIASGGELHQAHVAFLEWAGRYDIGGQDMRSRALHEAWLSVLPCSVVRLEGDLSIDEELAVIHAVGPEEGKR
jgi:hypothetical protein